MLEKHPKSKHSKVTSGRETCEEEETGEERIQLLRKLFKKVMRRESGLFCPKILSDGETLLNARARASSE